MYLLLRMLFACPKCWIKVGLFLSGFCSTLFLLGLSLARRVDRIEERAGISVNLEALFSALPLPIPVTAAGFVLAGCGVCVGLYIAYLGRWASKY